MRTLLYRTQVRNPYWIYKEGESYVVVSEDRNGQRYEEKVTSRAVDYVRDKLRGQRVTAEEVAHLIEPVAGKLGLAYTYGYKLSFTARKVLLVLVALGAAQMTKEERSYSFRVKP